MLPTFTAVEVVRLPSKVTRRQLRGAIKRNGVQYAFGTGTPAVAVHARRRELNFTEAAQGVHSERRVLLSWIAAHVLGSVALAWLALVNGFPMIFSDSGGYLAVGTELKYLNDRPVSYGLLIAPFTHLLGLWGAVVLQAIAASWLVGEVLVAVTNRRSPVALFLILVALAGASSLPWFVGQIMPDLATSLIALTLYLMLFAPRTGWNAWFKFGLLTGLIMLHLSHIPIAAALIGMAGLLLLWRAGWRSMLLRVGPAFAALVIAVAGLCSVTYLAAGVFRPSLESEKFLVAKTFDSGLGQPVLNHLCTTEKWRLCKVRGFAADPRRALQGQDYLWAADSPRPALDKSDTVGLRAEEGAFARRVLYEDPMGALRVAARSWRDQLVQARAADGMTAYSAQTSVFKQIHKHFPYGSVAFDESRQERGDLQSLAIVPDRLLALLVMLLTPFIVRSAIKQCDQRMTALVLTVLGAIVANAAVCGILSGPVDRYQSRVLWLLPLLGLIAITKYIMPKWYDAWS